MRIQIIASWLMASLLALPAASQVPTESAVADVLARWQQTRKRSLDGKPDPAAARVVGDLAIEQLTFEQMERLCAVALPQTADPDLQTRCRRRLEELAADPSAEGAVAAARLCEMVPRPASDAPADEQSTAKRQRVELIARAARHPGLKAAVADGRATSLFLQTYFLRDPEALHEHGVIDDLLPLTGPDWPAARVRDLLAFHDSATEPEGGLEPAQREKLRVTTLAVLDTALADATMAKRERDYLSLRRAQLDGAAARGVLLDHAAPKIDVLWSNSDPAPASLADLRGSVVVLDFWATWCVPCVAAFPHLRELQTRYAGRPVRFVGVTSLQGYVSYPEATDPKERRLSTPKSEDELARLGPWCKSMDVTWTVLVTAQDCFNPDFGVRSIPHLAVIDAEGRVRANGLSVSDGALEKEIDALLEEMKKKGGDVGHR